MSAPFCLTPLIPAIRRGVSKFAGLAYLDGAWWSNPGVLGYEWYVGSGWQESSKELFDAAAEVARVVGNQ